MAVYVVYAENNGDYALQYPGELFQQKGGIEIDPEERTVSPFVETEINGTPAHVQNGRIFRIPIPNPKGTSVENFNQLIDEITPYAEQICDGHSIDIVDGIWVGKLNLAAQHALQTAVDHCWNSVLNGDEYDDLDDDGDGIDDGE